MNLFCGLGQLTNTFEQIKRFVSFKIKQQFSEIILTGSHCSVKLYEVTCSLASTKCRHYIYSFIQNLAPVIELNLCILETYLHRVNLLFI